MSALRLPELEASFVHYHAENGHRYHKAVASMAEANGVSFLCPQCYRNNRGPAGTHSIMIMTPSVGAGCPYGPGRWHMEGTSLDDLTLVANSPSVRITGGCHAHFHVRRGKIDFCDDSGALPS
jgi:hypothetical protein